ncbi:MAG: metal ABC transporter ATP-binding protein [Acidimicrobiales bacterium]
MTAAATATPSAGAAGSGPEKVLAVEHVSVVLGGRTILDDVSFEVRVGEFTGLIGSNGAGKTTLLRAILGLQRTSGGRVSMPGAPGGRLRRSAGYVPQKLVLDPDVPLRARDLVVLGVDGNRFGFRLPSRERQAAVDEMLAAVGAERFAESRVGTLSGGELQRVLIAHALISRPRLLLLDEPLANLDPASANEIVLLLHTLATEHRVAVLLSAHEMNALLPVMDRIVYLAGGRAATGTTDEVVRPEVLSALYGYRVDVLNVHGRVIVVAGPGSEAAAVLPVDPSRETG